MRHLFGRATATAILDEIETPRRSTAGFSLLLLLLLNPCILHTIAVSGRLSQADWLVERLECLSRDYEPPAMYKDWTNRPCVL